MQNLFLVILLNLFFQKNESLTLKVTLKGFDNNRGKALVAIFNEKGKTIKGVEETILNQQVTLNFSNLISGKYVVKAFHDENSNQKLDTNLLGIPKEKWGVSNNVRPMFSAPKFDEMLFEMTADKSIEIGLR